MMKNKLSKYLVLTVVVAAVSNLGCSKKQLDLLPRSPTEATYFSTEGEFTRAVIGSYAKLTDFYGFVTTSYSAGPGSTLMPIYLLPGDDITTNNGNEEFEIFGSLQPSSGRVTDLYRTCYQLISRANVVLEKTATVAPGVYTTAGLKDIHTGEALFLRGFAYYYLWNYFGTAPLSNLRVTANSQFTPPSSTGTQLLEQAIKDFTDAAAKLPASWGNAYKGRATKNAAYGFLGKSLVFKASVTNNVADYTSAIAAFNSIAGLSLTPKFDDNFAWNTENNEESLFEFQASNASGGNNIWLPNDFDNPIGNLSIAWNYYTDQELYGNSRFFATQKLADAFDNADPRKALTLNLTNRNVNKYALRNQNSQGWQPASINNYRLLRLADIKLLKAEALLGSGGSISEAIQLINEVRTRARNMVVGGTIPANRSLTETTKSVVFGWINDERLVELAGEGQRWPDLRRWQLGGAIALNNAYFGSNVSQLSFQLPKHLNFPIPNAEIDVNPNVTQNAGY